MVPPGAWSGAYLTDLRRGYERDRHGPNHPGHGIVRGPDSRGGRMPGRTERRKSPGGLVLGRKPHSAGNRSPVAGSKRPEGDNSVRLPRHPGVSLPLRDAQT